jgi:6-O-methylguanine DNA methyltransferase, ribonuclease-like domain
MTHYRTIDSPIGLLTLAGHDQALTNVRMVDQTYEPSRNGWSPNPKAFNDAVDQLNAYFAGELTTFDLELDMRGTGFQRRVWRPGRTVRSPNKSALRVRLVPSAWPTATTRSPSSFRATGSSAPAAASPGTAVVSIGNGRCSTWRRDIPLRRCRSSTDRRSGEQG